MSWYIGIDTSTEVHNYSIMDEEGEIEQGEFPNTLEGYEEFEKKVNGKEAVMAIETENGFSSPLDNYLLRKGYDLYKLPPSCVKTYKENVLRVENKTDSLDAYAMAVLLKEGKERYRKVNKSKKGQKDISRHLKKIKKSKTETVNSLRKALRKCFPELLEFVTNVDALWVMNMLGECPDPEHIKELTKDEFKEILTKRGSSISRQKVDKIYKLACETNHEIKQREILLMEIKHLVEKLELETKQEKQTEKKLESTYKEDPEVKMLSEIRGIQEVSAVYLIAEIGDITGFETDGHLASYAGLTPKIHQTGGGSGKHRKSRSYNRHLKDSIMQIAANMSKHDPESRLYYLKKRKEGFSETKAKKALGRHILRMIYYMLKNNKRYNVEMRREKLRQKLEENPEMRKKLKEKKSTAKKLKEWNL